MRKSKSQRNDLVGLLNERKAWELPSDYRPPQYPDHVLDHAAQVHARANDSDPWAFVRMRSHMAQGMEVPSDIVHDANAALARRSAEHRSAFGTLEGLKRQLDQDRAWNQHRAAQYTPRAKAA